MKISELLTFMNEHGGAKAFMFYWEVADECEDIQFGAEDSEVSADDMEHYIQEGEPSPVKPTTTVTAMVAYPVKTVGEKQYGIVRDVRKGQIQYCPYCREKGKTFLIYGYWTGSTCFGALNKLDKYLQKAGIKIEILSDYVLVAKNDRKNNIHGLTPEPMEWLNRIGSIPVPVQLYEEWW